MEKICKNCQFITYAKGTATPLPLCLNKYPDTNNIWAVKLTGFCRNFKSKTITRKKITQPTDPSIRLIPLNRGRVAIVDAQDYERLNKFKWYLVTKTASSKNGYAKTQKNGKAIAMHRYLTNCPKGLVVDHIDHNGLNNTKANLRICTQKQNTYNNSGQYGKTSKYKGVCKIKGTNKFRATITNNYKSIQIGVFGNEREAAKAYDAAARKYHGEFAYLNFPE